MFTEKNFQELLTYINKVYKSNFIEIDIKTKSIYNSILKKGRTKNEIKNAIDNCYKDSWHKDNQYKYITPEYFSREKTLNMFGKKIINNDTNQKFIDLNNGKHRNI